jgi:hypothetical protein
VYGQKAFKAIITDPNIKTTPLPLWGEFSGVLIHIVHKESFRNAQAGFKYRKIVIFAHHPQHLFWARRGDSRLIHQDKIPTVAAAITGVRHTRNYYTDRLFPRKWPSAQRRHLQTILTKYKARGLDIDLSKLVQDSTSESLSSAVEGVESSWEQAFDEKAHSNTKLYELLPAAIYATKLNNGD